MATKRVESFWAPCLDAGSTPATSTDKKDTCERCLFCIVNDI